MGKSKRFSALGFAAHVASEASASDATSEDAAVVIEVRHLGKSL